MNRLALGTAQFGLAYGIANRTGQVSRSEAKVMIEYAKACEIRVVDTAMAYGESEACLGAIGVGDFRVVTKLPAIPDELGTAEMREWVRRQVSGSRQRLRLGALDGLLLHRPGQLNGKFGVPLLEALLELKALGIFKKLGISIYAPDELEALKDHSWLELVQVPLNPLDRRIVTTGWLQRLKTRGIEIHARSVFLQGLLLMPMGMVPRTFNRWKDLLWQWHEWLAQHHVAPLHACLAFALSHPEVDQVVVGADSTEHLRQIVAAASGTAGLEFPDLSCEDLTLINPSLWQK